MRLSPGQELFLSSHGLSIRDVLDGRGKTKSQRETLAREAGKALILVDRPCQKGHYFKTRSGHCPECNPAYLAYQKRHTEKQTLYIAGSRTGVCLKIGVTADLEDRHRQMNEQKYGGVGDWEFLFVVVVEQAGRVESTVLSELRAFAVAGSYFKSGKDQNARELLRVPIETAFQKLAEVIQKLGLEFVPGSAKKLGTWANFRF